MKKFKKTLLITLVVIIAIQFIKINKINPPVEAKQDYVVITQAPKEVKNILKKSCYDCHSNEVFYPWYTNVAPISWYIKDHVNEGRKHVNFSEFGKYNDYQKIFIYDKLLETAKGGYMPLDTYLWMHKEAKVSAKDQQILVAWFSKFVPQQK